MKEYTIEQLERLVETRRIARDAAQAALDAAKSDWAYYAGLLRTARLDAFWARFPGVRLEADNDLKVTPEAQQWMYRQFVTTGRRLEWQSDYPGVHAVFTDSDCIAVMHGNSIDFVPVAIAQSMRQAFLDEYFPGGA